MAYHPDQIVSSLSDEISIDLGAIEEDRNIASEEAESEGHTAFAMVGHQVDARERLDAM